MQTGWDTGYFVVINPGTTEYLIGKDVGIFTCVTIRRLPDDEAFDPAIIDDIKVRYRDYMIEGASPSPVTIRPASIGIFKPDPKALFKVPRRARLRPDDFLRSGYTVGCPGCEQIQQQSSDKRSHNEKCRPRIEHQLAKTDEGNDRLGKAKD